MPGATPVYGAPICQAIVTPAAQVSSQAGRHEVRNRPENACPRCLAKATPDQISRTMRVQTGPRVPVLERQLQCGLFCALLRRSRRGGGGAASEVVVVALVLVAANDQHALVTHRVGYLAVACTHTRTRVGHFRPLTRHDGHSDSCSERHDGHVFREIRSRRYGCALLLSTAAAAGHKWRKTRG